MSLKTKHDKYLRLIIEAQDPATGFIEHDGCDALLFTGLVGCVPKVKVGIMAAFDKKTGMWHRRPTDRPCFDCKNKKDVGSKSSISRDMLIGLAWYAYHNNRLDLSEQVIKYAMSHWGFMGEAENLKVAYGRCQILPALFSTFCWISYRLGGPKRSWARWIPADVGSKSLDGFQAHLQVMHILLRRELEGWISKKSKSVLKHHANRQPTNPLFQYAVGNYAAAKNILMDEQLWPSDRLPTRGDRKGHWLQERDYGPDWAPAETEKDHSHSGGDFLFASWLVLRNRA